MKKYLILCVSAFVFVSISYSQTEFGANYQYSAGKSFSENSFGLSYEGFSVKNSWTLGINYNLSSFGSTKGTGFDVYAGYRHGFSYGTSGNLFAGLKTSLSFDKDKSGKDFSIFTPSIEGGYHYTFNNFGQGGFATPSVGVGYNFWIRPRLIGGDYGTDKKPEVKDEPVFQAKIGVGYRF